MPKPVDLSEFEALNGRQGGQCSLCQARGTMTPANRAKLDEALRRVKDQPGKRRIKHTTISGWLKLQGFEISAGTVARHRSGECTRARA